jgi:hypothetical protein
LDYDFNKLDALWEAQDRACAICHVSIPIDGKTTHLDHDHDTKKVRGVLCNKCNMAIGLLHEDLKLFQAAVTYLGLEAS